MHRQEDCGQDSRTGAGCSQEHLAECRVSKWRRWEMPATRESRAARRAMRRTRRMDNKINLLPLPTNTLQIEERYPNPIKTPRDQRFSKIHPIW